MSRDPVIFGGASGFWGDSAVAFPQLLRAERIDYIVFDFLAEVTMSILARARAANDALGYATDFVSQIAPYLPELARRRIRLISNAGGVNPAACAEAIRREVERQGLSLRVGLVEGDGVLDQLDALRAEGVREMFSDREMPASPLSANAYLGAMPVAAALEGGADIVVTGRCVDSALVLGACVKEFGWAPDDWDRLAAGSLAGHLIECGAQASGGLFTDWEQTGDWADIGYPIAEIDATGSCVLTKVAGTGGLVSVGTAAEQLVYEIGDPASYLLPDVCCDFTGVRIEQAGPDRVRVDGARGRPPGNRYKVSMTYEDGYRLGAIWTIVGHDARRKAAKVAEAVLRRVDGMLATRGLDPFTATDVEILGSEESYGANARCAEAREVLLKIAASHPRKEALSIFLREFTSAGTSMAPGFTGLGGHRPKPMPMVRLFSCLIDKGRLSPRALVDGKEIAIPAAPSAALAPAPAVDAPPPLPDTTADDTVTVPLRALAFGRSGDKGDNANIGIIARDFAVLPYLWEHLSPEMVGETFAHYAPTKVERFFLPGPGAINFLLHDCLGGGGTASLRNDPQGKGFAQILLDTLITLPSGLLPS